MILEIDRNVFPVKECCEFDVGGFVRWKCSAEPGEMCELLGIALLEMYIQQTNVLNSMACQ